MKHVCLDIMLSQMHTVNMLLAPISLHSDLVSLTLLKLLF